MQFVQGLPAGVFVGQTRVHHDRALETTQTELQGFNLALHVQDDAARVQQHRMILLEEFAGYGVDKITWMTQTHSTICRVVNEQIDFDAQEGDGLVTQRPKHALMMMTADCLPVVVGNADGTEVANLHAGWRGLAHGIIENTIASMNTQPTWAWLGAAISQPCFQTGAQAGKYYADLYAIAKFILKQHGVEVVSGGDQCSFSQSDEYFSYRRHAKTGRMGTFVFMQ